VNQTATDEVTAEQLEMIYWPLDTEVS